MCHVRYFFSASVRNDVTGQGRTSTTNNSPGSFFFFVLDQRYQRHLDHVTFSFEKMVAFEKWIPEGFPFNI